MGRSVNFDAVPDTNVVPDGVYRVSIAEFEEKTSKNGKLMYNARLEIIEPQEFEGMGIFEMFVIGSDDDLDAQDDATWVKSFGARRMKNMLKAAGVPLDNDMDTVSAAAIQQELVVAVSQKVETEGDYAGRVRNNIGGFFPLGQKEVGLNAGNVPTPKAMPKVAPAPAQRTAPASAIAGRPIGTAHTAPAPAQPVRAAQPAPAARPTPAAPRAAVPKASPQVKCTICDSMVERATFADHVEGHANEG